MRLTLTMAEAAAALGVSKTAAYQAAHDGKFPVPVLRVGGRFVVPIGPLCEALCTTPEALPVLVDGEVA